MPLPIDVVFARSNEIVALPGGQRVTIRGGTHWPADDPIVKQRPDLFTRDSRFGMLYTEAKDEYDPAVVPPMDDDDFDGADEPVADDEQEIPDAAAVADEPVSPVADDEQATAAPGERRSVRRPRS